MPFSLSSYISLGYLLVFLPMVILSYSVVPRRFRWAVLLVSSYLLFWSISEGLIVYLLLATLLIYLVGRALAFIQSERQELLEHCEKHQRKAIKDRYKKRQRALVAFGVVALLGTLITLKYSGFFAQNGNSIFQTLGSNFRLAVPEFVVPIGISFYTLQGISYLFDVSRETVRADKNLGRVALYMAFFPQLIEGPICRYHDTAYQLTEGEPISYHNLTFGLQRMAYGIMKKMIVADRLNLFIKTVFGNHESYDGGVIFLAGLAYTIQLYMEFSGTMDVVIGSAEIFGIRLPENFQRPFFSRSISEFWKRWHITLGSWFKDYVFYPLSMSKQLKKLTSFGRKHLGNHFGPLLAGSIALFAVWLLNGLWHGAGWTYIAFGMFHFVFILLGSVVDPFTKRIADKLHIDRDKPFYREMQIARTGLLVVFGEIVFRAESFTIAVGMITKIFTDFTAQSVFDGSIFKLGMDRKDVLVVCLALMVVLAISLYKESGRSVRKSLSQKNVTVRWATMYLLIVGIIVFGAYGFGYVPIDPIYANF